MPAKNFNFKQFNLLMETAGIGLKLHLVIQMLKDVDRGFHYFDNELAPTITKLVASLQQVQTQNKQQAKDAALKQEREKAAKQQESEGPAFEDTCCETTSFADYPVDTTNTVSKID